MQKNVSGQKWIVFAFDVTDNTAKTGDAAQITAEISKDGAAGAALGDTNPTELEDGYYVFDLTQAETNADMLALLPESSTSNIQVIGVPGVVYTTPPNFAELGIESDGDLTKVNTLDGHTAQTGDSYARIGANGAGLTALATAANLQTVDDNVDSVLADTNELQTNQGNWLTATGFSTHSAADVWAVTTRTLSSFGTLISNIWSNVTRTLTAGTKDFEIDSILTDTGTTIPGQISALNNISASQVNAECDQAIADAALATAAAVAALNNLSQADIRTALGMAAANLDTQIDGLSTFDAATDEVEANIKKVNDITVNGSGTEADPWSPA